MIGITPMYESLMKLCGIKNYKVVFPYNNENKIENVNILIVTEGYKERINFDGEIIEVSVVTFDDLIDSINKLAIYGDKRKINKSIKDILKLKKEYIEKTKNIKQKVFPQTQMIYKIAKELSLKISEDGIKISPDYEISSNGRPIKDADIFIPTHKNSEKDVIKRICQRYDLLIDRITHV